jgi:hypothetical protein
LLFPFAVASYAQKSAWKPLFNGKDLTGWKHVGPGGDTVEDGLIKTHGGMGLLYWTGGKVSNCRIRVVYKMRDTNDNSGVSSASPSSLANPGCPFTMATKCKSTIIRNLQRRRCPHYRHTLFSYQAALQTGKPGPQWNTMIITRRPHTLVELNGQKVTDYTEGQAVPERKFDFEPQRGRRPDEGWIGLQNHSDNDIVFFKEISIQPLR